MPTYDLEVEVAGEVALNRRIANLQAGIEDFEPLWDQVAAWFYQMEARQFATEGHGDWKPLAASTVKQRQRTGHGGPHPILELSGKLAASLLGAADHVRIQTPTTITLGTAVRVGKWNLGMLHQKGTNRMPARPVIGRQTKAGAAALYQEDATSLRSLFAQYVHQIAKTT